MRRHLLSLVLVLVAGTFAIAQTGTQLVPTGKGWAVQAPRLEPSVASEVVHNGNGILYHGGPVMHGSPVHVYFIWYGNWANGPAASD
jgi:hypothetical protein